MRLHLSSVLLAVATGLLISRPAGSAPTVVRKDGSYEGALSKVNNREASENLFDTAIHLPRDPGVRPRPRPRPRPDPQPNPNDPGRRKCSRGLESRSECDVDDIEEASDHESDSETDEKLTDEQYGAEGNKVLIPFSDKIKEFKKDENKEQNLDKDMGDKVWTNFYENRPRGAHDPITEPVKATQFGHLEDIFKDLNLDLNTEFKGQPVYAKPKPGVDNVLFQDNFFSTRTEGKDGVIVCRWNKQTEKQHIKAQIAENDRLFWSDLWFKQLKENRNDGPVDDIKYVVRHEVNNAGTKEQIEEALKKLKVKPDDAGNAKATLDRSDSSENADIVQELMTRLTGTVNGRGVVRALTDYVTSFGGKEIKKIHLYQFDHQTHEMVLELGPA